MPVFRNSSREKADRMKQLLYLLVTLYAADAQGQISTSLPDSTSIGSDTKYILIWSPQHRLPLPSLGIGDEAFKYSDCAVDNCFVTDNRSFFPGGDLTKFDAIAFSGQLLDRETIFPSKRAPHQKYVFLSSEPYTQHPICESRFDDFFNWTATYRLDSSIPWTYFDVVEKKSRAIVGPRPGINWKVKTEKMNETFKNQLRKKTKAVAWFTGASCSSENGRESYALSLHFQLRRHKLKMDVYGGCGTVSCTSSQKCLDKLNTDYFFYLAMEQFSAEDYVTQELLIPLKHDVVPIVFGGADYSRFLPPDSYLEVTEDPRSLAEKIYNLIQSPQAYSKYFQWKNLYSYELPKNVCRLCAALHSKQNIRAIPVDAEFRTWWHPNYTYQCTWHNFAKRTKAFFG